MSKKKYFVEGMHCPSCEIYIESQFEGIKGIKSIKSNNKTQEIVIDTDENVEIEKIIQSINKDIEKNGYSIKTELKKKKINIKTYLYALLLSILLIAVFFLLEKLTLKNDLYIEEISYTSIFLIGIIASVSSCMAVVGSLVLSISSSYAKKGISSSPMILFHISRIAAFFILGGILGAIGSLFIISQAVEIMIGVVLFAVMVVLGLNLLEISPWFRKLELTIPKGISSKFIKKAGSSIFTPILLGAVTFFLPCGFTQAMQLNAVVSGTFLNGALTMFIYSLGTLPILLLITIGSKKITDGKYSEVFLKAAGFLVLFFAIYNLIGVLTSNGIIAPIF